MIRALPGKGSQTYHINNNPRAPERLLLMRSFRVQLDEIVPRQRQRQLLHILFAQARLPLDRRPQRVRVCRHDNARFRRRALQRAFKVCIKDSTLLQRGIKELIYSPLLSYAPHFLAFRVYVVREERERERDVFTYIFLL